MTKQECRDRIEIVFDVCMSIRDKKNNDYCKDDDPFQNFRLAPALAGVSVEQGLLVRLGDKMARISTLIDGRKPNVVDEKLGDTILDAINYLAILKVWCDNEDSA